MVAVPTALYMGVRKAEGVNLNNKSEKQEGRGWINKRTQAVSWHP